MSSTDRPGVDDPGLGRRLGVDVGAVRVGVALSDPGAFLATPLVTLARDEKAGRDLADLVGLVAEHDVVEVVVGLPRTLAGRHGPAAEAATAYAAALAGRVAVPVRLHDERLTTVTASRVLAERGVRGKKQRAVVDQAAAVEILQSWLDARARHVARSADEEQAPGAKDRT
ncbi:Holliday junction resolvase RuvX [Actinosynnema sp. NPDC050436]|uniref:Holliday junction resolvase RuvX n=1 Tax=Actinosynnema sp. NPDC050436 TaxID=3155659 RepID=UPI0033D098B1